MADSQLTQLDLGQYEATRAAALSGVPTRTLYSWAQAGLIVPSVSASRQKYWSYGDLLTLRLVRWLRTPKTTEGVEIARTTMSEVRRALEKVGTDLWAEDGGQARSTILVTSAGKIVLDRVPPEDVDGQVVIGGIVDLFAPFEHGPDLRRPRPHLRITPGKVAGEPHLVHSRLTTRSVAALAERGLSYEQIAELYPQEDAVALEEALDLEQQLAA